ncbi:MAG: hypothetical protein AB3N16_07635 [Flavobacteriaceae bacterium]
MSQFKYRSIVLVLMVSMVLLSCGSETDFEEQTNIEEALAKGSEEESTTDKASGQASKDRHVYCPGLSTGPCNFTGGSGYLIDYYQNFLNYLNTCYVDMVSLNDDCLGKKELTKTLYVTFDQGCRSASVLNSKLNGIVSNAKWPGHKIISYQYQSMSSIPTSASFIQPIEVIYRKNHCADFEEFHEVE